MIDNEIKNLFEKIGVALKVGDDISSDYCHDEYPGADHIPEAVVEAHSTDEVAAVLKLCSRNGITVTVRGAGTGRAGGSVPVKGGIVLSTKEMAEIMGYEDGLLRVQPGVLLRDVKAEAEKKGLYYPPDPGEATATLGGNAATNASGPCAVKYGRTRDYIADAVIVLADGTVTTLAGNEDVIGSEGTLGIITELRLRLIDKPGTDAILLLPFMNMETAAKAAQTIAAAGFAPAVMELMDTEIIEFSGNVTGNPVFPIEMDGERIAATLMVTIEGEDDDSVMDKMEQIAEMADELECLDILVGDSVSMKRDFRAAHAAFHTSMESGARSAREANLSVPSSAVAEMIDFAKALGGELGLKVLLHAHIGSGGMHIHVVSDLAENELNSVFKDFETAVYAKCVRLGGNIAGEYGIGYAKTAYLDQAAQARFKELKAEYDPNGILNPGKVTE